MRKLQIVLVAGLVLSVFATTAAPAGASVKSTIEEMTLREKVGQLVMFAPGGTSLTSAERTAIKDSHLGGLILFARNYSNRDQLGNLNSQIQRAVRRGTRYRIGALISVDQEGGVVKRFPDMPPHYSAPEMGRRNDKGLARSQGRLTGSALRSAGLNVNLAPVADLDIGPNHVMRDRAFGSRPGRTGKLVRAFAAGLEDRKVSAVLKHFPGIGGATINTDDGRSYVYRTRWQLRHIDAVPFEMAIDRGVDMVMLSHAIYPEDGGSRPASLNKHIATRRLRRDLGFQGVAISDSLGAIAWRFGGSVSKACPRTVAAGVDIALMTSGAATAQECARKIYLAVRAGDITKSRIDKAVLRILRLKRDLKVFSP